MPDNSFDPNVQQTSGSSQRYETENSNSSNDGNDNNEQRNLPTVSDPRGRVNNNSVDTIQSFPGNQESPFNPFMRSRSFQNVPSINTTPSQHQYQPYQTLNTQQSQETNPERDSLLQYRLQQSQRSDQPPIIQSPYYQSNQYQIPPYNQQQQPPTGQPPHMMTPPYYHPPPPQFSASFPPGPPFQPPQYQQHMIPPFGSISQQPMMMQMGPVPPQQQQKYSDPNVVQSQQPLKSKRTRRKRNEVERLYFCNFPNCNKGYGSLSHLNGHIVKHGHGKRRHPEEFTELRKLLKDRETGRKNSRE